MKLFHKTGITPQWIIKNLGPDVPLHFNAFHPAWKMLNKIPTSFEALKNARDIAIKNGLNFVYIGNVHDINSSSTYCSKCKNQIIVRDGYKITVYKLNSNGQCLFCGTICPGVY